jgi:FHA domain
MRQSEHWPVTRQAAATRKSSVTELSCPNCQQAYRPGGRVCVQCGAILDDGKTTVIMVGELRRERKPVPSGAVFVEQHRPLFLEIDGIALPLPTTETLTIGRNSERPRASRPDVDLSHFKAAARGVSRQHIRIMRRGDLIYICDLGSTNGTFLNGRRLISHQERLLRCGDELRLGRLRLGVRF